MTKIDKAGLLAILDLKRLELRQVDEFASNKNRDATNAGSFIQSYLERFPSQKPMPLEHPGALRNGPIERRPKSRGEMLPTDWALDRAALKHARAEDKAERLETRRLAEKDAAHLHAERWVAGEIDRRRTFFAKVKQIMYARTDAQEKARRLMLEYFHFEREEARQIAQHWRDDTRTRIYDAADNRREWLEWRLSQFFQMTPNGSVVRTPGRGQKLEAVAGEMFAAVNREIVAQNRLWHDTNYFIVQANGGMARAIKGQGEGRGKALSDLYQPVVQERSADFERWHDSSFMITTPNGGLLRAHVQGTQPEAANAKIYEPIKESRVQHHRDYQFGGMLQMLPNGSYTPLPYTGQQPGRVLAARYWPLRTEVTEGMETWHDGHMYKQTPNGGMAPLPGVGQSYEHESAVHAEPVKEKRTEGHAEWHANHMFGPTPNGGMAPLSYVGKSYEHTSAAQAQPLKEQRTAGHDEWHAGHMYAPTPNGGMAPRSGVGKLVEKISADQAQPTRHQRTADFQLDYESHRYAPTPNQGFAPLKTLGGRFEEVAADIADITKDEQVQRFHQNRIETRADERQQVELKNQQVSKSYRDREPSEAKDTQAAISAPLAGAGGPQADAPTAVADDRTRQRQLGLREIQKNLAAHETTASQLQGHANVPEHLRKR